MNNIKFYIILFIFCCILGVGFYLKSQVTYYKSSYEKEVKTHQEYVLEQTKIQYELNKKYNDLSILYNEKKIKAEENALQKIKELTIITNNNKLLLSRLHDKIDSSDNSMSSISDNTSDNRITYSQPFKECSTELVRLAEVADTYVIDIQKLKEAWPKNE